MKQAKHFAVLALPPVIVDHQNCPYRRGNPSQHRKLESEAKRCLKYVPIDQEGKPGQQNSNYDHWRSLEHRVAGPDDAIGHDFASNRFADEQPEHATS
jgi:hypothetical protein